MTRMGAPNQPLAASRTNGVCKKNGYVKCCASERSFVVSCVFNQLSAEEAKLALSGNPKAISFNAHSTGAGRDSILIRAIAAVRLQTGGMG